MKMIDKEEIDVGNISVADDLYNTLNELLKRHNLAVEFKFNDEDEGGVIELFETEDKEERENIERHIDMALDELKELGFSKISLIDVLSPINKPLEQLKVLRIIRYGKENLTDDLFLKADSVKSYADEQKNKENSDKNVRGKPLL